jgi:hypothetical protein
VSRVQTLNWVWESVTAKGRGATYGIHPGGGHQHLCLSATCETAATGPHRGPASFQNCMTVRRWMLRIALGVYATAHDPTFTPRGVDRAPPTFRRTGSHSDVTGRACITSTSHRGCHSAEGSRDVCFDKVSRRSDEGRPPRRSALAVCFSCRAVA